MLNLKDPVTTFQFQEDDFEWWLFSCKPVDPMGNPPQVWGCKSAIWKKKNPGHDLSMDYPGEVELDLKYPTLISWVHFKHNVQIGLYTDNVNVMLYHEMTERRRFFKKIGKTNIVKP